MAGRGQSKLLKEYRVQVASIRQWQKEIDFHGLLVVEIYSSWFGACQVMLPTINQAMLNLAPNVAEHVKWLVVNVGKLEEDAREKAIEEEKKHQERVSHMKIRQLANQDGSEEGKDGESGSSGMESKEEEKEMNWESPSSSMRRLQSTASPPSSPPQSPSSASFSASFPSSSSSSSSGSFTVPKLEAYSGYDSPRPLWLFIKDGDVVYELRSPNPPKMLRIVHDLVHNIPLDEKELWAMDFQAESKKKKGLDDGVGGGAAEEEEEDVEFCSSTPRLVLHMNISGLEKDRDNASPQRHPLLALYHRLPASSAANPFGSPSPQSQQPLRPASGMHGGAAGRAKLGFGAHPNALAFGAPEEYKFIARTERVFNDLNPVFYKTFWLSRPSSLPPPSSASSSSASLSLPSLGLGLGMGANSAEATEYKLALFDVEDDRKELKQSDLIGEVAFDAKVLFEDSKEQPKSFTLIDRNQQEVPGPSLWLSLRDPVPPGTHTRFSLHLACRNLLVPKVYSAVVLVLLKDANCPKFGCAAVSDPFAIRVDAEHEDEQEHQVRKQILATKFRDLRASGRLLVDQYSNNPRHVKFLIFDAARFDLSRAQGLLERYGPGLIGSVEGLPSALASLAADADVETPGVPLAELLSGLMPAGDCTMSIAIHHPQTKQPLGSAALLVRSLEQGVSKGRSQAQEAKRKMEIAIQCRDVQYKEMSERGLPVLVLYRRQTDGKYVFVANSERIREASEVTLSKCFLVDHPAENAADYKLVLMDVDPADSHSLTSSQGPRGELLAEAGFALAPLLDNRTHELRLMDLEGNSLRSSLVLKGREVGVVRPAAIYVSALNLPPSDFSSQPSPDAVAALYVSNHLSRTFSAVPLCHSERISGRDPNFSLPLRLDSYSHADRELRLAVYDLSAEGNEFGATLKPSDFKEKDLIGEVYFSLNELLRHRAPQLEYRLIRPHHSAAAAASASASASHSRNLSLSMGLSLSSAPPSHAPLVRLYTEKDLTEEDQAEFIHEVMGDQKEDLPIPSVSRQASVKAETKSEETSENQVQAEATTEAATEAEPESKSEQPAEAAADAQAEAAVEPEPAPQQEEQRKSEEQPEPAPETAPTQEEAASQPENEAAQEAEQAAPVEEQPEPAQAPAPEPEAPAQAESEPAPASEAESESAPVEVPAVEEQPAPESVPADEPAPASEGEATEPQPEPEAPAAAEPEPEPQPEPAAEPEAAPEASEAEPEPEAAQQEEAAPEEAKAEAEPPAAVEAAVPSEETVEAAAEPEPQAEQAEAEATPAEEETPAE